MRLMDLLMMKNYIQQKQAEINELQNNFYTSSGIHVYIKDPVELDIVQKALSKVEERLPSHLINEIEMIIFGWFTEFEERDLRAFYDSGTLYISNVQYDDIELFETIVHEIAHAVETTYGYEIYGDGKVQDEFVRKRRQLHDILWDSGYKMPISFFVDTEYNQEFDELLYKKIGYQKLDGYAAGLFISSYAATSLREYFATAFAEYFTSSNHNFLRKVSPLVYKKINSIIYDEQLDI